MNYGGLFFAILGIIGLVICLFEVLKSNKNDKDKLDDEFLGSLKITNSEDTVKIDESPSNAEKKKPIARLLNLNIALIAVKNSRATENIA